MDNFQHTKRGFEATRLSDESTDDDSESTIQTKRKYENYSGISLRMMEMMGYRSDTGLGKEGQGRLEPVEASTQKGRRGLGLKLDGIETAAQKWSLDMENVQLRETANWLQDYSDDLETLSVEELKTWMVKGTKKLTIDDECIFCDPDVLDNVLAQKSIFDNLGADDMRNARTRCNPFETIGSAIFLNRAAVKMANMDALFDFMFTKPIDEDGAPLVHENDLLYFADVCAGPGGFSEYVLWRKQWGAKGFGFTLRQENDFKLDKFLAGHPETFETYYGCKGDGDIYDPENVESLTNHILKQTMSGVHFMMSDGGFSVEGQENVQEVLSKRLYLCQCLTALSIVRVNGHFVTKLFDTFTPFSVGLIYLMYKCFHKICVIKPNTSRPANSERYLVCKWKKSNTDSIRNYLFDVNLFFHDTYHEGDDSIDVNELVPLDILRSDEIFFSSICESNNNIGHNQVVALMKIAHYCKDTALREQRQEQFKVESLRIWQIPNEMRKSPLKPVTDQLFKTLLDWQNCQWHAQREFMDSKERCLSRKTNFSDIFFDKDDWAFVPLDVVENSGKTIRTFFMSKGNGDVYKYTDSKCWTLLNEIFIEISPNTLLYGEIVKELTGEGSAQRMVYSLHIIDGIILGGVDIRNFELRVRNNLCRKFAAALNKPQKLIGQNDQQVLTASIRCKQLYTLVDLRRFFGSLQSYRLKDNKVRLGLSVRDLFYPERFYVPRGILLFKILKPNLCKRFDKKLQSYFYTDLTAKKHFLLKDVPDPNQIYSSFKSTFAHRRLWKWEDPRQVDETIDEDMRSEDLLYRMDFERYVYGDQTEHL